jgi:hypothetical protein
MNILRIGRSRFSGETPPFVLSSFLAFLTALAWVYSPVPAFGWGGEMHRLVNRAAVDNLPRAMVNDGSGNAFGDWRNYLVEHASDPDFNKSEDPLESERHWLDIDAHLNIFPYPFTTIPRTQDDYLLVFTRADGVNPWEGWQDTSARMTDALRQHNWAAAYREAAWLGHYVADSFSPMHATENYNGQLSIDSRNRGIHSRHESALTSLYISDAATTPGCAAWIDDPVEQAFSVFTEGWVASQKVLAADLAAQDVAGDGDFNATYYAELWRLVGEDTQAEIDAAARLTASMWYTVWVEAGRPAFGNVAPSTAWMLY